MYIILLDSHAWNISLVFNYDFMFRYVCFLWGWMRSWTRWTNFTGDKKVSLSREEKPWTSSFRFCLISSELSVIVAGKILRRSHIAPEYPLNILQPEILIIRVSFLLHLINFSLYPKPHTKMETSALHIQEMIV